MAVRLGYDAPLLAAVAGRLARAVMQDMRRRVKQQYGLASVATLHAGVVTVVQRFRSDLGLYVHLELEAAGVGLVRTGEIHLYWFLSRPSCGLSVKATTILRLGGETQLLRTHPTARNPTSKRLSAGAALKDDSARGRLLIRA